MNCALAEVERGRTRVRVAFAAKQRQKVAPSEGSTNICRHHPMMSPTASDVEQMVMYVLENDTGLTRPGVGGHSDGETCVADRG